MPRTAAWRRAAIALARPASRCPMSPRPTNCSRGSTRTSPRGCASGSRSRPGTRRPAWSAGCAPSTPPRPTSTASPPYWPRNCAADPGQALWTGRVTLGAGCHTWARSSPLIGKGGVTMPALEADTATSVFVGHRELLFSVVYNLLGGVADTEDVLQETWLSWSRRCEQPVPIANPRSYLVRIAVNAALARQATIPRRRVCLVRPCLPVPVASDVPAEDPAVRSEAVSLALLVVLE